MKYFFISLFLLGMMIACDAPEKAPEQTQTELEMAEAPQLYRVDSTGFDLPLRAVDAHSPLEGASNFRKPFFTALVEGKIYRSDALHELTETDVAYLDSLGIKTVVDLRNEEEIETYPDRVIPSVVNRLHFPVGKDQNRKVNLSDSAYAKIRDMFIQGQFVEVEQYMDSLGIELSEERNTRYQSFALNHRGAFGNFLKALADSNHYPLVYHCQGGKDRAGFASALMERTLGATEEEIMQDYLMTNVYGYDKLLKMKDLSPNMKIIIGAHADQIQAAFLAIDETYGSFENYLKEGLMLTEDELAAIRKNLLGVGDS